MSHDPRLERYLTALEQALKPFPVSDRAEIITEIRSHVLSALERDPQTRLDTVLSALGEPETVANRYLLERGLKPAKPPISPIVKWLVIGFLATLAMVLIFVGYVIGHVSSIVKIDGEKGRVQVLGGLIDIDGGKNRVTISGATGETSATAGASDLSPGQNVEIKFTRGNFEIGTAKGKQLGWVCKGAGNAAVNPESAAGVTSLDFSRLRSIKCQIGVPAGTKLSLNGQDGHVEISEARFDVDVSLENGAVEFTPDAKEEYKFDVSVGIGKADTFESSTSPLAHAIKIHVANGKITNNR